MKKVICGILVIPIILALALWGVNLITGILAGEINIVEYLRSHSIVIAVAITYLVVKFVIPNR